MLIDLDDNEIHRIFECLDAKASSMETDDSLADECNKPISRLEIIGATAGHLFVKWNIEIEQISIQDEGRTMKIFIKNKELS